MSKTSDNRSADDDFLTPNEVADRLRVSMSALRAWRREGIGPKPVQFGPQVFRYRRGDVEAWIRRGGMR